MNTKITNLNAVAVDLIKTDFKAQTVALEAYKDFQNGYQKNALDKFFKKVKSRKFSPWFLYLSVYEGLQEANGKKQKAAERQNENSKAWWEDTSLDEALRALNVDPESLEEPEETVQPVKPVEPVKPAEPVKPTVPEKTAADYANELLIKQQQERQASEQALRDEINQLKAEIAKLKDNSVHFDFAVNDHDLVFTDKEGKQTKITWKS